MSLEDVIGGGGCTIQDPPLNLNEIGDGDTWHGLVVMVHVEKLSHPTEQQVVTSTALKYELLLYRHKNLNGDMIEGTMYKINFSPYPSEFYIEEYQGDIEGFEKNRKKISINTTNYIRIASLYSIEEFSSLRSKHDESTLSDKEIQDQYETVDEILEDVNLDIVIAVSVPEEKANWLKERCEKIAYCTKAVVNSPQRVALITTSLIGVVAGILIYTHPNSGSSAPTSILKHLWENDSLKRFLDLVNSYFTNNR